MVVRSDRRNTGWRGESLRFARSAIGGCACRRDRVGSHGGQEEGALPLQAIAIVDGTGEFSDESYAKSMANSFCTQIAQQLGGPNSAMCNYQRGPTGEGARTGQKGREAAAILKKVYALDRNAQLFLAGYSRGGSAAIIAA